MSQSCVEVTPKLSTCAIEADSAAGLKQPRECSVHALLPSITKVESCALQRMSSLLLTAIDLLVSAYLHALLAMLHALLAMLHALPA